MDKLTLAHEYALKIIEMHKDMFPAAKCVSSYAFDYAEAMLAENEKRTDKTRPAVLEEFQVDWSQAPRSDVVAWDINKYGQAKWIASDGGYYLAPSFNYQGDWKDSLRERP